MRSFFIKSDREFLQYLNKDNIYLINICSFKYPRKINITKDLLKYSTGLTYLTWEK